MATPNLRPGLTEKAFREYETIIRAACQHYPVAVKLSIPEDKSILTHAARIRDALKSYRENSWPLMWDGTHIRNLSVHHTADGIFISGSKRLDTPGKQISSGLVTATPSPTGGNSQPLHLDLSELEAFCLLVSRKHLKGPIVFTVAAGTEVHSLEALFDVAIIADGPNQYILT